MSRFRPRRALVAPAITLTVLVSVWELSARGFDIPAYLLPAPSAVVGYIISNPSVLLDHALSTFLAIGAGFALAVTFGVLIAVLMVWWPAVEEAIYPLLVITQVTPKIAIAPMLIIYLGFGRGPKIFLAFLVAFFPMVINTTLGLRSVPRDLIDLLTSLRASKFDVFRRVRFPNAMPYAVEGAKISIALSVIGTIVSEFTSGSSGLGYLISSAAVELNTVLGFSALAILILMGTVLFQIVRRIGRGLVPWTGETHG